MPEFCDVAVPVPLDMVFTYRVPADAAPVVGGRVLVPFRQQRMTGIVVELHDRKPAVTTKNILSVARSTPVLDESLLRLGRWIADYYLAPIGEVFRTMLPLTRGVQTRRSDTASRKTGHMALHLAGMSGSSARSRRTPEEQAADFACSTIWRERLKESWCAERDSAIGNARFQQTSPRLAWSARNGLSARIFPPRKTPSARSRSQSLKSAEGKLNDNQRTLIDTLAAAGGRVPVETLQVARSSRTTLGTLVRRGLIEIIEEPADFTISRAKPRPSPFDFEFNAAQKSRAARLREAVDARKFSGMLLHGVTGSGKTAVYLAGMRSVLEAGRSAILLVPEIGLTPAVAADLHQIFGDEVAILHSALSDRERAEQWHRIKRGDARMVVGTRSAVFAPVADLALIIVDEEHDSSYKQEETPRYHARDVAVMRAKMSDAVVVLGSATPSLESYFNAKKNKYALIELPDRVEQRPLPEVEIVDMRLEFQETGHEQVISRKLAAEIKERLERKEQVMVLLNRRGYSPVVLCRTCGKKLECQNCAIALTHHKREHKMVCHYCGYTAPVPKACVHCGSEYVYFLGTGSEKLEELLHGMFPQARIARLDRDTVRGHEDFERTLERPQRRRTRSCSSARR